MKKNLYFCIIGSIALILIGIYFFYSAANNKIVLSESKAISILKAAYPEFENYPNDKLPPQSIRTEKAVDGWYVAFVQEGSGRPILGAKCFFIKNDESIGFIAEFSASSTEDIDFSIKTCD